MSFSHNAASVHIALKNTPAKYEHMMELLAPPLFSLLIELDSLETELFARLQKLHKNSSGSSEDGKQEEALWQEYKARYKSIIDGKVSEKLISRSYAQRCGNAGTYFYAACGAYSAAFTMRKKDAASVVTQYESSLSMKHKFVFRLINGTWLIDAVYCGFGDESAWHITGI